MHWFVVSFSNTHTKKGFTKNFGRLPNKIDVVEESAVCFYFRAMTYLQGSSSGLFHRKRTRKETKNASGSREIRVAKGYLMYDGNLGAINFGLGWREARTRVIESRGFSIVDGTNNGV